MRDQEASRSQKSAKNTCASPPTEQASRRRACGRAPPAQGARGSSNDRRLSEPPDCLGLPRRLGALCTLSLGSLSRMQSNNSRLAQRHGPPSEVSVVPPWQKVGRGRGAPSVALLEPVGKRGPRLKCSGGRGLWGRCESTSGHAQAADAGRKPWRARLETGRSRAQGQARACLRLWQAWPPQTCEKPRDARLHVVGERTKTPQGLPERLLRGVNREPARRSTGRARAIKRARACLRLLASVAALMCPRASTS